MKTILSYIREGRNYVIALLLTIAVVVLGVAYIGSPVGGDSKPVILVVRKGDTAEAVGARLSRGGLIRSSLGFALIARASGLADEIKPGAYKLSPKMSVRDMLDKFISGKVAAVWVTIPEGFTASQIAGRLAAKHLVDRDEFLALVDSGGRSFSRTVDVPSQSLEGYLFPNTYLIVLDSNPKMIVGQMLQAFKSQVAEPLSSDVVKTAGNDGAQARSRALYQAVVVASMIEREAKVEKDRPLISAVIWNRLRKGMKLEVDATVQYALGEHRGRLFYSDLAVISPYNTYRNPGLPPGPISNPGLASIKAALHPANVDYLYYVARPDGSHVFSHTLEEHNAAKARIRRGD